MKTKLLIFAMLILVSTSSFSQDSPKLNFTGSSPSLSKGNIDTEVLTAIIQKKQEEIKQRVFRNTIIKQFNSSDNKYQERLNNLTTYNYLYSLMDILTSGKNKRVMTKSAIEKSAEFAFVYGLALYTNQNITNDAKISLDNSISNSKNNNLYDIDLDKNANNVCKFNVLVDMIYDIILENENEIQELFNFKESIEDVNFKRWYDRDNKYQQEIKNYTCFTELELTKLRAETENKIKKFLKTANTINELIGSKVLENKGNFEAKAKALKIAQPDLNVDSLLNDLMSELNFQNILDKLKELEKDEIVKNINNIKTNFKDLLNENQIKLISELSNFIDKNYDVIKNDFENLSYLVGFYSELKKSEFKDFSLTQKQYDGLKYILIRFIKVAKHQHPNEVIANVLEFLLENTIVEYNNENGNIVQQNNDDQGYLYIDIESLIYTIDDNFSSETKRSWTKYITPFFSIGTNYASFNETNSLISNSDGTTNSLGNLYFASEKIGVKWKLYNWKYKRAFKAGESYNYYGSTYYWLRPQEEPLISDMHIILYGSGLLYNLVDLKSENNFNYAIVGTGFGFTFFNGLAVSVGIASPIIDKNVALKNSFLNLGLDIPIIEYISALSKKK